MYNISMNIFDYEYIRTKLLSYNYHIVDISSIYYDDALTPNTPYTIFTIELEETFQDYSALLKIEKEIKAGILENGNEMIIQLM